MDQEDIRKKVGKCYSKVNRGQRLAFDSYQTPYSLTRQLLDTGIFSFDKVVLEPACGQGAILKVLREQWADDLIVCYDGETDFLQEHNQYDYMITNPPYSLANEFILHAKEIAVLRFALLLPLNYLHGKRRYDLIYSKKDGYRLWRVFVFTRMPMLSGSIQADGLFETGMQVYAWFVWQRGYSGLPYIDWLDNNEYVRKRTKGR